MFIFLFSPTASERENIGPGIAQSKPSSFKSEHFHRLLLPQTKSSVQYPCWASLANNIAPIFLKFSNNSFCLNSKVDSFYTLHIFWAPRWVMGFLEQHTTCRGSGLFRSIKETANIASWKHLIKHHVLLTRSGFFILNFCLLVYHEIRNFIWNFCLRRKTGTPM